MSKKLLFALLPIMAFSAYLLLFNPMDGTRPAQYQAGMNCDDFGGDWDGDGVCADFDCDDSDPENTHVQPDCDDPLNVDDDMDGYTENDGDCDDNDFDVNPGASEVCNDGIDNDCDGDADCADSDCNFEAGSSNDCDYDGDGYTENDGDCDDNASDVNPGASEVCNDGIDNDCDGDTDCDDSDCNFEAGSSSDCDYDGDGYTENDGDCDDNASDVNPGASEVCNDGIDNDCDGDTDCADSDCNFEAGSSNDCDYDGDGYTENDGDCDDNDYEVNPGVSEVCDDGIDNDCDGDTDCDDGDCNASSSSSAYCDYDGDGYTENDGDCDDDDDSIYPNAQETCNSIDDDCDGETDEEPIDGFTFYADTDNDTYGDPNNTIYACSAPTGYVEDNTDCDDNNSNIYPGADELCNGVDDDCDGSTDEDAIDVTTWYEDGDGDGYGNPGVSQTDCDQPPGYILDNTDCDDADYNINPGATEICDGYDNNCDGTSDEGFTDEDEDGVGDECDNCVGTYNPAVACLGCLSAVSGQPDADSDGWGDACDCDDANNEIYPGAAEICDEVDNDCDGFIDEDLATTWYQDSDGDGFGDPVNTKDSCAMPSGFVDNSTDCNDSEPAAYFGALEICDDGIDNDCDSYTDCQDGDCNGIGNDMMASSNTYYADTDEDGYGDPAITKDSCALPIGYVADNTDCNDECYLCNPGATEICDGLDNDCNGLVDDGLETYFADFDADNYYNPGISKDTCAQPQGYISLNEAAGIDCNDGNDQLTNNCPSITYYVDSSNTDVMALTGRFRSALLVGESWDMAFTTLQAALATAVAGDTIKVAQGTYYPGSTRDSSFIIPNGVVLLGGYPMGGGSDEERNWDCYKTILSGDIGTPDDNSDNSYHVVVTTNADSSTQVDGFCITGGNANGTFDDRYGGGWFNRGTDGDSSNPTIIHCRIFGNNAARNGGGIGNFGDLGPTNPRIINSIISGNTATRGAGIYNYGYGSNSSPVLINCILSGNRANYAGGGIYNDGEDGNSSPILINCVLNGNYAGSFGSAAFNTGYDGDMTGNSDPFFVNCVIWNNDAGIAQNVFFNEDANLTVSYSVLQGTDFASITDFGYNATSGIANTFFDPAFINAPTGASAPTTAGDFHVLVYSPCINHGDNTSNSFPTDLDDMTRIFNGTIDAGAYEFQSIPCSGYTGVAYVNASAAGLNNGSSWTDAFTDLQDALAIARTCGLDTILVAEGTYYPSTTDTLYDCAGNIESIIQLDSSLSFDIPDSLVMIGGYQVMNGIATGRDPWCFKTLLCGDIDQDGEVYGDLQNSMHVVTTSQVSNATVVDGFHISGGNASESYPNYPDYVGGGWYDDGSGMNGGSFPTILNCVISGNWANGGGGIFCDGTQGGNSSPRLINCILSGNGANASGGAMFNDGNTGTSSPSLDNCVVSGNIAYYQWGGGMYNSGINSGVCAPQIRNSIFWNNFADISGPVFHNNEAVTTVSNSILQGSTDLNDGSVSSNENGGTTTGSDNLFSDPLFINAPAAAVPPTTAGDFRVASYSPAVNFGYDAAIMAALSGHAFIELNGNPRIAGVGVDAGVFEYQGPDCTLYTGITTLYVDAQASGTQTGADWPNALLTLKEAIEIASYCTGIDSILVAGGTYYPSSPDTVYDPCTGAVQTVLAPSRQQSFILPDGITLLGGYPTGGMGERDPHCNLTILSGDIDMNGDSTGNTFNIIKTIEYQDTIVFDGFIIEQGNAIANGEEGGAWWDGSRTDSALLCISNTIFRENYAVLGGAFYGEGTRDLKILASEFYENTAAERGGAVYFQPVDNMFDSAFTRMENVLLHHNTASVNGGAIAISFHPNISLDIIHATFSDNSPDVLNKATVGPARIRNSIIWNNISPVFTNFNLPDVQFSIVQDGFSGTGNKFEDPLFRQPGFDYRLQYASPAIDMGDNVFSMETTDLDDHARIQNGTADMGAYEFQAPVCSGSGTAYVDSSAEAGGDGTSWETAFNDLQQALVLAYFCQVDTILVAQGTYYPSRPDSVFDCSGALDTVYAANRDISFNIPDSITILGGFPTGGGSLEERDWECNKTILCGEIQQDGDHTNNSYHVVTTIGVDSITTVDGFCIQDGYAVYTSFENFPTFRNVGGGWLNIGVNIFIQLDDMAIADYYSNPRILNCTFYNNNGLLGAGLGNLGFLSNASPLIYNCNFNSDSAILGGAIANIGISGESSPYIVNTKIQGNTGLAAGGILNLGGSVQLIFGLQGIRTQSDQPVKMDSDNAQVLKGLIQSGFLGQLGSVYQNRNAGPEGAQYLIDPEYGVSAPLIINSLITGNAAAAGGGMVNAVLTLANEEFIGLSGESSPRLINCDIAGNLAEIGAGILNTDFILDLTNGLSPVEGGGRLRPCIENSILWNNDAGGDGNDIANMFDEVSDSIKLHHSITGDNYLDLNHNCIECVDTLLSGNKLATDPLFVDAPPGGAAATTLGNFHLQDLSPAINMGENSVNPLSTDLDGLARIVQAVIDIGAYEKHLFCTDDTLYVGEEGSLPPVEVILEETLPDGYELIVNGLADEDGMIELNCSDTGHNELVIEIVRGCIPVLVDSCHMNITILDTFEKNLVCNDLVNVSLGAGCLKVLDPDDFLENIRGCRGLYDIQVIYPLGTHRFPGEDQVDLSHIGLTMVYNVYEVGTGNKCWGYLKVEDKQPPLLNCSVDTITCYELPDLPLLAEGEDSCSGAKVKLVSEQWFDYGCDEDPVLSGYVIRTIQGSDNWGNFARCTDTIFIRKTVLDSLVCPELIELPCEITHQIGSAAKPIIHTGRLKYPIQVDRSKVTPEFLLELQKPIYDLIDPVDQHEYKGPVLNPFIIVVPQIEGKNIYPAAGGSCKITAIYNDVDLDVCGAGFKIFRKWIVTDWCTLEEEVCEQYIKVVDTSAPRILKPLDPIFANVSPHDCVAGVVLPALSAGTDFRDCGTVSQKYTISYEDPSHPGKTVVLTGDLPSKTLYLPMGEFRVEIHLADACFNRTDTSRYVVVTDVTPPIPVCNEITQVTIDPATCWAKISAKELDNGSRDNCCEVLHYAAAHMDSITYWRNYWTEKLITEVGEKSFAKERLEYEALIEDWINCYVFSDTVNFTDCGSDSIVLRVYEACGVPRYDPHVFPCGPHAWFCYNTYEYIGDFNWNWFDKDGPKSCSYRPALISLKKLDKKYEAYGTKGYMQPKYEGAAQYEYCQVPFYFPSLQLMLQAKSSVGGGNAPGSYCSDRLYNDCMVLVLVDDKEAPVVHELEDVTVYCDDVPYFGAYPKDCSTGKKNGIWPGYLKDRDGTIHGYYGGYGVEDEHAPDCGHYDHKKNWAPVYCREWLYLDSFDTGGIIVPETYFEVPVFFDKTRPKRALAKHEFSITDNCRLDDSSLTYTDDGDINACGEGWIQRTWTMRDACGNEVIAKQKVLVKHRSDFEVIFPADTVMNCDLSQGTGPEVTGRPDVTDDECEQIAVKFTDEIYSVEDGACYKIVRTWTLFDWCIYEPNRTERYPEVIVDDRLRADTGNRECVYRNLKDNNDGYMQYIQVIKVVDHEAPAVSVKDTVVCITSETCISETVIIPLSATDNCAEPEQIHFQIEIDQNATESVYSQLTYDRASIEQIVLGNPRELVFAPSGEGRHVVHVIGTDQCGNRDTASYRLELKDCKKPTPYCYAGIATVVMPSTGRVTVWAKDLDAGSYDNCTDKGDLIFSFSANQTQTSREFSCADIPNGRSQTVPVEIWVTDEAGNQDHCGTYILLQDNAGNICPDTAGLNVTIAGTVQTEGKEPVEHVRVDINGTSLDMSYETGSKGSFHFEALPSKTDYTLKANRNDQPMNGISTLDLILIQKHILGTLPLDSPYKIIAADVDNDKQVTAIDLVELRKLILASYEQLPNTESWRVIPKAQEFSDPQNPWNFKTQMEMKGVEKDYMQEDWIGIKTGDVNASAAAHSLMGTEVRENQGGLIFEVVDRPFNAGELVTVEFRSPNFRGISGFQGTVEVDGGWWVVDGSHTPGSGALSLSDQNFGTRRIEEGFITMSWNANTGIDVTDKEVLFTMTFKAKQDSKISEALRIGSQLTVAESYEGKGEPGSLGIRFVSPEGNEVSTRSELYQNYPNPFDQRTVIGLRLAKEGRGTLSIHDVTGRTIRSIERDWTRGYHEVWLDRREIGATGVLYYRFESGFFTDSKKMVIVE